MAAVVGGTSDKLVSSSHPTSAAISPNLNHRIRSLKRAGSPSNNNTNTNTAANNASQATFGGSNEYFNGFQAPQQWSTKTNTKLSGLQAFRNDALMSRPSGIVEKTSLPLISKLDSDGDSPNCSDDEVAIGANDDFLTSIGAKDS